MTGSFPVQPSRGRAAPEKAPLKLSKSWVNGVNAHQQSSTAIRSFSAESDNCHQLESTQTETMQSARANFVTIEQLGVWIERRKWFDQSHATRLGFAKATLDEIIEEHRSGSIRLSAIVDGDRSLIERESIDDYIFEITWAVRAGLFVIGSNGNCEVRGRSIQVFLPEKLVDLGCRSSELVHSPSSPEGTIGYHRVLRQMRVKRQDAARTWPASRKPEAVQTAIQALRDQIVDVLLLTAGLPNFPTNSIALFDIIRQASSLSSLSNAELEQFISITFPKFWSLSEHRWKKVGEKETGHPCQQQGVITSYSFKRNGRLSYDWPAIEDALLVDLLSLGLPPSHGYSQAAYRISFWMKVVAPGEPTTTGVSKGIRVSS